MSMNCVDVQRLILPFINNELELKKLEEFIDHVNTCPECMEELEVYYVLLAGMKQLDEDRELSNDFHKDFIDLLTMSEDRILHNKFLHIRKRIVLIFLITIVAIISSFRIGEFVVEDVINKVMTSNYRMENRFYKEGPYMPVVEAILSDSNLHFETELNRRVRNNLADIYVYLRINKFEGYKNMEKAFGDKIWRDVSVPNGVGYQKPIPEQTFNAY